MQSIFISSAAIHVPPFFTKYYTAAGDYYQRIESSIDAASFDLHCAAVRIELYRNSECDKNEPVLVGVVHRAH